MSEKAKCAEAVYDPTGWGRGHQCTRAGVVERDGKFYCRQHDPVARAEQDAKRSAKWDEEYAARQRVDTLHWAAPDLLEVCKEWVATFDKLAMEMEPTDPIHSIRNSFHGERVERTRAAIAKAESDG